LLKSARFNTANSAQQYVTALHHYESSRGRTSPLGFKKYTSAQAPSVKHVFDRNKSCTTYIPFVQCNIIPQPNKLINSGPFTSLQIYSSAL